MAPRPNAEDPNKSPEYAIDWVNLIALAVNEENAFWWPRGDGADEWCIRHYSGGFALCDELYARNDGIAVGASVRMR